MARFKKLKAFRTIANSYKALKDYLINIKNLKKDVLLRKRLTVAKNNDRSFFNDNGELVVLEEDSIEEHNFFKVFAQVGSSIKYEDTSRAPNPNGGLNHIGLQITKWQSTSV